MVKRVIALGLAAATLAQASAARADDDEEIAIIVAAFGLVDVVLVTHAVYLTAKQAPPDEASSVPTTLVALPQAIALNVGMAVAAQDDPHEMTYAVHVPAMVTTALTCYGAWSLALPDDDPGRRFLACTGSGIASAWTAFAISTMFGTSEDFEDEPLGLYESIWQIPNIAIGIHQAVETNQFKTGWIALSTWSSLLAVHGIATWMGAFDDTHNGYAKAPRGPQLGFAPTALPPAIEGAPPGAGLELSGTF